MTGSIGELSIEERGHGEPLVVFVHGVLDRGRSFRPVSGLLEGECRMIWYDRRGYGSSLEAPGAPVGVDGHIDDLLGILDGRRAVVVGHSFGGVTALGAATVAPELVSAVVLYETGMAWIPGWDDTWTRETLWAADPDSAVVRMMLGDRFDRMPPQERAAWLAQGRAFVAEERSVRTGAAPFDVTSLKVPLVYGADQSARIGVVAQYLTDVVDQVEVVELPGAGHNAHRTQPEQFADLVRRGIALAS